MKDLKTVRRARGLRRSMSKPEVVLWRYLRGDPRGLRFRRQHVFGNFVLDFYCPKAKLAVEVDGIAHDMGDQPAFDLKRDEALAAAGIVTVRIPALDVLRDAQGVAERIVRFALSKVE
ncbi:DUF559 domain-containing protein [Novosphingobium sp. MW5]|nr:DUF559 domain-containing protein [Novosphingobium sp. MW5]